VLCEVLDLNHSLGSLSLGIRRWPAALSPVPLVRACPERPRAGVREVKGYSRRLLCLVTDDSHGSTQSRVGVGWCSQGEQS